MGTNAINVAKYFLSKSVEIDGNITNLKLQKLLYYAQGYHLALFNSELFQEEIFAWTHGPVCPEIYHEFKIFGSNVIDYKNEENFRKIFTEEQLEFLDEVYNVFGQFSAWKLRDMTHEESPWINNKDNNGLIPKNDMKDYFITRIN